MKVIVTIRIPDKAIETDKRGALERIDATLAAVRPAVKGILKGSAELVTVTDDRGRVLATVEPGGSGGDV